MKLLELSLMASRKTRVALRCPVKISTRESNATLDAQTIIINKHGAKFECEQLVDSTQEVVIMTSTGKSAIGQVIWADARPNSTGKFEFAVELNELTNIFGLFFPEEDQKDWEEKTSEFSNTLRYLTTA